MNPFIEQSFYLAQENYLDKLHHVYPIQNNFLRSLSDTYKSDLKVAYDSGQNELLLSLLLNNKETKKFPIKDSYVPFLSKTKFLSNNPETVNRIIARIKQDGFDKMIEGMEAPIESNRQMGQAFRNWAKSHYPCASSIQDFISSTSHVTFLDLQDIQSVIEVRNNLGLSISGLSQGEKGLDLVMKVITSKGTILYLLGEAKFLSDEGGHQNSQLKDALDVLTGTLTNPNNLNVIRVALLDGVCWINKRAKMQNEILALQNEYILSALILDNLLKFLIDTH